uniref:Serine-threonine/tyrosine-protein kinase catalytic domain-containing protein n=1 Tax=Aegilops tauschii TaxID=37682 RepID=N1R0X6_AEGTA
MRRIRHRSLIKIITSCSSMNHQGQEYKALFLKFMPNEYWGGIPVSTARDINSLNILLLEMFRGRSQTEGTFGDSLDLHKCVEYALPDRALEIADMTMWLHSGQHNNTKSVRIQEFLVSVLSLGISCSKQHLRDQELTSDATAEMHTIRDAYLKFIGEHGAEREASTQNIQSSIA